MNAVQKLALLFTLAVAPIAGAQEHRTYFSDDSGSHAYLFRSTDGGVSQTGDWGSGSTLRSYADAHDGSYVLFTDGGKLYRLDRSPQLEEAEKVLAPMKDLEAQQKALAQKQKPLAQQQHELSVQMKAAQGNTGEIKRLAEQMSSLGQQQGALGREQGELGREQGEIGKAFHTRVERLIEDCLKSGSCHAVQS